MTTRTTPRERDRVITELSHLLGSSYVLSLKTQNFHWNVTGPSFSSLHSLFEEQYHDLATAVDEIAERIRALGAFAPGSFAAFRGLSAVDETEEHPAAEDMVKWLAMDQESIIQVAQTLFDTASAAGDQPTADLATRRLQAHEKHAWMLSSHLR